jgi:hypothetical protein
MTYEHTFIIHTVIHSNILTRLLFHSNYSIGSVVVILTLFPANVVAIYKTQAADYYTLGRPKML